MLGVVRWDRRISLGLLALYATSSTAAGPSPTAEPQPPGPPWRIGVLMPERPGARATLVAAVRDVGYVEGRNRVLEPRVLERSDQLPTLDRELVRLNPHVLASGAGRATLALTAVTTTVSIVMAGSGDADPADLPVEQPTTFSQFETGVARLGS